MTDGIGVYVLRGHFDEFSVWSAAQFSLELEFVIVVFERDAWGWHRVRQLFFVIEPPAIVSE